MALIEMWVEPLLTLVPDPAAPYRKGRPESAPTRVICGYRTSIALWAVVQPSPPDYLKVWSEVVLF